jgi:hypothetical protein
MNQRADRLVPGWNGPYFEDFIEGDVYRHCMGAKLCIHPTQIACGNDVFNCDEHGLDWAGRVVAAAGADAAVRIDGEMVDRPACNSPATS